MTRIAAISVMCMALCGPVLAQDAAAPAAQDIGTRLDQKLDGVAIKGMEIEGVLADLSKQTGVEITLDESAAELLPWGRQTKLTDVTISNSSLRSALTQMLSALGMTYEIRDDKVVVVPTEPLRRMRRRPTWDELKLLRQLSETEFKPDALAGLKIQYRITSKVDGKAMLTTQLDRAGHGTVADMLETATGALSWVWFVEEDHVVIRTMEAQIASQLGRQVSVRYTNVPLSQILSELADKAGVLVTMDPGMMLKLPPSTAQSYTLLLQSVPVRQALELICGETGLKYEIRPNGVHLSLSDAVAEGGKAAAAAAPRTSPYVAKISVPSSEGGYTLEFLVRADELPADVLEARGQMLQELIQKVRKEIAPPTQPAQTAPGH